MKNRGAQYQRGWITVNVQKLYMCSLQFIKSSICDIDFSPSRKERLKIDSHANNLGSCRSIQINE